MLLRENIIIVKTGKKLYLHYKTTKCDGFELTCSSNRLKKDGMRVPGTVPVDRQTCEVCDTSPPLTQVQKQWIEM